MPYPKITPYTHPERFTDEEKAMYDAGLCGYQTAYGGVSAYGEWDAYCTEPSMPGADFGFCTEHTADIALGM